MNNYKDTQNDVMIARYLTGISLVPTVLFYLLYYSLEDGDPWALIISTFLVLCAVVNLLLICLLYIRTRQLRDIKKSQIQKSQPG